MNNAEPIEIEMKLEVSDVLRYFYKITLGKSRSFAILSGLVFLNFLLLSGLLIRELIAGRGNTMNPLAFLPILAIAIIIISVILIIFSDRKNAKKTRIIFSEQGINVFVPDRASRLNWEVYQKIIETKKDFMLLGQAGSSLPIPKRFFESREQIRNFRILVREKLGEKAELRND